MTAPQFFLTFLVLNAPPVYWMWWHYSKSHPSGRWRRLLGGTAVIGMGIVLFWGWFYMLDRLFPKAGVLTQQLPLIIGLFPVVVALALIFACIMMVVAARWQRQ